MGRFHLELINFHYLFFHRRSIRSCWECCDNNEWLRGKQNTTIEWDDGGKIDSKNKLIVMKMLHESERSFMEHWKCIGYVCYFHLNPLSGYFPYLLMLPKWIKQLWPGLVYYDNLINAEMISALSIHLTLLKTWKTIYKFWMRPEHIVWYD